MTTEPDRDIGGVPPDIGQTPWSQSVLVERNTVDWANLARRMAVYYEFPPAWLPERHEGWDTAWEGVYATRQPLLDQAPDGFDGDYGYVAYVELR